MATLKCTKCGEEYESELEFREAYGEKHGVGPIQEEIDAAYAYADKCQNDG